MPVALALAPAWGIPQRDHNIWCTMPSQGPEEAEPVTTAATAQVPSWQASSPPGRFV